MIALNVLRRHLTASQRAAAAADFALPIFAPAGKGGMVEGGKAGGKTGGNGRSRPFAILQKAYSPSESSPLPINSTAARFLGLTYS